MAEVDGPAPAPVPQPTPADGHLSDQVPATAHTDTTREQSGSDEQSISFNRPSEGHGELVAGNRRYLNRHRGTYAGRRAIDLHGTPGT